LKEALVEAKRRTGSTYAKFRKRYWDSPADFVRDCIKFPQDKRPISYQLEIVDAVSRESRVSARGPHGLGKTALASWLILWFALTRDGEDWKVPTTASNWRHLTKYLWPEVHKWARRLRWDKIGRDPFRPDRELMKFSLALDTGEAFALASTDAAAIEGAHAAHLLYLFDEAKAIPTPIWDAAEGALSSGECYAVSISTPGEPIGRFYDIQRRRIPGWWIRHVTLEEAVGGGMIRADWVEKMKGTWGETNPIYKMRVLGEFSESEKGGVISLDWVERANNLWEDTKEAKLTRLGVDVARYGEDLTAIALGSSERINEIRYYGKADTMETTGRVSGILNAHPEADIIVDVIGVGAGVVDRLRELGYEPYSFSASEKTDQLDKSGEQGFADKRSASWWMLRELLEEGKIALPPDERLIGELVTPLWKSISGGRIRVESKDQIEKRIGRSTDAADAVIMCLVGKELCDTGATLGVARIGLR